MTETLVRTKLARLRLERDLSQQEISRATGLSLATYQRLERGLIWNPPLRYLVNCAIALGVELEDVVEEEWRQWHPFSARAKEPPDAAGER